jgi:hypothetical protein
MESVVTNESVVNAETVVAPVARVSRRVHPVLRDIVRYASSLKPVIQLACGEKMSDSGKVSLVYASFHLHAALKPIDLGEALAMLEAGNTDENGVESPVRVSIPRQQGVTVRLSLSPVMTAQDAAKIIREYM